MLRKVHFTYLATVTFVDHLLGKLLHALDQSVYSKNTWIVLWSDHGWYLGEKEHWGKATGWLRSTRVPLIIVPPDSGSPTGLQPGSKCDRPVNLIDLYPTVVEMAGLSPKEDVEGTSLMPLISDPESEWSDYTVTTFGRGNHAVSTRRWRYIQYFDGSAELYDRNSDPNEWRNLNGHPDYKPVLERFKSKVPEEASWEYFIRYRHFKAVIPSNGGSMLLFNHALENHLEERTDESGKYPEVVEHIRKWMKEHSTLQKRIVIPD